MIFNEFLKLFKRQLQNDNLLSGLMDLCTRSICVNGSSKCLKEFIGQLNISRKQDKYYEVLFTTIFSALMRILSTDNPREVFSLSGNSDSGIRLRALRELPKGGYCFCGSIWIERKDQSKRSGSSRMTIYKLEATAITRLELFIANGHLNYQVNTQIAVDYRFRHK